MKKAAFILSLLMAVSSATFAAQTNFAPGNVSDGTSVRKARVPKKSLFGFGESEFWKKEAERSGLKETFGNAKSGVKALWLPNIKNFFDEQRDAYIERNN